MRQFGLIGYPVSHSLSPWIHHEFSKRADIQATYKLYELAPEEFNEKISALKRKLDGFNLTLPYKEKIIPFLDDLDETAKESGAVNTVVKEGKRWLGYNTDGIGFVRSLSEAYPQLLEEESPKLLILGAGGAARGIFQALRMKGFSQIDLANRTIEHAQSLAQQFSVNTRVYSLEEIEARLTSYDLIIQTSSVGMAPRTGESIIQLAKLKKSTIVSDIVYQPLMTDFLKQAKAAGAHIHLGHTMLLYQALYAFEKWTKTYPSVEEIGQTLKQKLKGS